MTTYTAQPITTFPDTDGETSGYVAAIRYDSGDGSIPLIRLPGWHLTFVAARDRARRVAMAILEADERGLCAHVAFGGDRPAGFPKNGVDA